MSAPAAIESVLRRMYERTGVDALPAHLQHVHGVEVRTMSRLDAGVFRVDRADGGAPLVVRLFSASRPHAAAQADLAVLRFLAEKGFPAERPFGDGPLSSHDGQAVLVTEFVVQVPTARRPPHPIVTLGALIGRLNGLPVPAGADRPAGALHHFAEGTMSDELRAAAGWLDAIQARVPRDAVAEFDALRTAVADADGGDGLPEALIHPDPVPKNVVFTAAGPVLVDWTSAGRGPRLAALTLVLRSGWAAVPFLKGYARRVTLTDDERGRLPALLLGRRLSTVAFGVCRDPATLVGAARKLPALRRDSEKTAAELLAVLDLAPKPPALRDAPGRNSA